MRLGVSVCVCCDYKHTSTGEHGTHAERHACGGYGYLCAWMCVCVL